MALSRRVGPFRALLAAHLEMGWNRTRRGLGRKGLIGVAIVLVILMLACLPIYVVFGFLGYKLGHGIDQPLAPLLLGTIVGTVSCVAGFMGGVLGGTRQLTWEAYRAYPISFRLLFVAELVAGVGDILALAFLGVLLSLAGGFLSQRPALLPLLSLFLGQCLLWMLCIQQLVGALAVAVVKKLRYAAFALALAAWAGLALVGNAAAQIQGALSQDSVERLVAIWSKVQPLFEVFPPVLAAHSMQSIRAGEWVEAGALEVPMMSASFLLLWFTYLVLRQEARPAVAGVERAAGPIRRRGFRHPALGLAHLHLHYLLSSVQGRFGLIVPLVTLVLIKGPFANSLRGTAWVTPGAVTYLAITVGQLSYNQFGFDGQGIKTLLLLPISMRQILLGKALAHAAYCSLQYALLFGLLLVLMQPSAADILGGALMGGCLIAAQTAQGHFVSVLFPRPLPFTRMQGGGLHVASLIPLGLGLLNGSFFGGVYSALLSFAPRALVPGMASLFVLSAFLYRVALRRAEPFVLARRERLVEILG